jgi:hypothetical protein
MPRHDDYPDDSELGASRVVHNHYTQNGNGAALLKISLAICGGLLLILVAITGFMWRDQVAFQRDMIDRLARVETRLGALDAND